LGCRHSGRIKQADGEKTNASGEAGGRIAGDKLSLSVSGGGLSGSMTVAYAGARQVVTISTQGIRMRSVNVTLAKG
jgi:hypothetical protein